MSTMQSRTPWQVTRSVWFAMFMREAVSRTMADRMGWFWMIVEPIAIIIIMVAMRAMITATDSLIMGADFIPWMIVGLMGFFMVRDGMMRGLGAVDANKALFAYRQVQPIDPVLVRNFLEGILHTFLFTIFIAGGLLLGLRLFPDNVINAFEGWIALWILGLGLGLIVSVICSLVPELGKIIRMASMPLMIISGAFIPLHILPPDALKYVMLNPITHGLELLRHDFFEQYHMVKGTSNLYLWLTSLTLVSLGMLLHMRYKERLKAQ